MHGNTGKLLYILGTYYGVLHEILTLLTLLVAHIHITGPCYQTKLLTKLIDDINEINE